MLVMAVCLTACGSKNYEMSFDEAIETVSHSNLQNIISNNDYFQENFNILTNFNNSWSNISANIETQSQQSKKDNTADSSINFEAKINDDTTNMDIDWNIDLKLVDETLYFNLESLNLTWSEETSFLMAMVEWFKNQWFSIPISGLNDISTKSLDTNKLNNDIKEILKNEWSLIYSWRFAQFEWYNARKISLDTDKIQSIINDYYTSILEDSDMEIPQLDIQNFEWYLVIIWKDKVAVIIDNMDIISEDTTINANWFCGEDYNLILSSYWEEIISISANKNISKYDISLEVKDLASLKWTLTPKISKSSIDIKFNVILNIISNDMQIPLKGNRFYEPIPEFSLTSPENSQDLSEALNNYLWATLWDEYADYDYEYDYEDNLEPEENYIENLNESIE